MEWEQVGRLELEQLYYEENLSDSLIAERFGISKNEVRKKRKLYNVSIQMHSIDNAFLEYSRFADTRLDRKSVV